MHFIRMYREWLRSRTTSMFVKRMEAYQQDRSAGNGADRLRHALMLEVLQGLKPLGDWSYRETHAGAGLYPVSAHSRLLLKAIREPYIEKGAGSAYRHLLSNWWGAGAPGYPGSVLLAMLFFNANLRDSSKIDIRVTEVEPVALARLSVLNGYYGVKVRADSFDNQLEWLCQGSHLFFVVDPYVYDREARSTLDGRLGRVHLFDLFKRLSQKEGAVCLIFTADTADSPGKLCWELKRDIAEEKMPLARHFLLVDKQISNQAAHNYYLTSIVGFGKGVEVVRDIPGSSQWNSSWLNNNLFREVYSSRIEEI